MCLKYSWSWIDIVCTNDVVLCVSPVKTSLFRESLPAPCPAVLRRVVELLDRYFQGETVDFANIPLYLGNSTYFQRKVWQTIRQIPYGQVRTYKWLADRIGQVRATRAVGNATGSNPIALLIPCHRVLRSNGELGGYSGGGIERKRQLLTLEATT